MHALMAIPRTWPCFSFLKGLKICLVLNVCFVCQKLTTLRPTKTRHPTCGSILRKYLSTDHSKPLIIPAGMDSLSQIGSVDVDLGTLHAKTPLDLWKKVFERFFPPESTNERKEVKDPAKDPQYSELLIDAMRAQKDQELEQYKREQAKSWKGLTLES